MIVNLQNFSAPLITRFAPSPTGYLHLGHIASMAFVFGIARAAKARLLLRIEDHDRGRCRPEFEQAIFEDLNWLGFTFDDHPQSGKPSDLRQSDRTFRYQEICDRLLEEKSAYRCICTRSQIQKKMQAATGFATELPADELFYDGTCRSKHLGDDIAEYGVRLITPNRSFTFLDGIAGQQVQNPAEQCGDFLIKDRHGSFTYQFAVAIDDYDQNVNLIIRGTDLLAATGRQILTRELLGLKPVAQFIHHPLITDASGKKLSKRFFSEAVAKKRSAGVSAEALLGQALFHAGVLNQERPVQSAELSSLFKIRMADDHC